MIKELYYIFAPGTNPYENLALESILIDSVKKDSCILYLWQNQKTVVIGKNQNPWNECKVRELEEDGGYLARRLSGGGAVFHDLGNLNFSFIAWKKDYHVDQNFFVLSEAIRKLGIHVEKSGRNDVTINGQKFSGNAFSDRGGRCCHHGTIMIDVNKEMLSRYLTVSAQKLKSKGVASVKSRVCNLIDHCSEITVEQIQDSMITSFSEIYELRAEKRNLEPEETYKFEQLAEKYGSWDWRFGRNIQTSLTCSHRFLWGEFSMEADVQVGIIKDILIYSDALESEFISQLSEIWIGCVLEVSKLAACLDLFVCETDMHVQMKMDISQWILQLDL